MSTQKIIRSTTQKCLLMNGPNAILELEGHVSYQKDLNALGVSSPKNKPFDAKLKKSPVISFCAESVKIIEENKHLLPEKIKTLLSFLEKKKTSSLDNFYEAEKMLVAGFNLWFAGRLLTPKREKATMLLDKGILSKKEALVLNDEEVSKITFPSMSDRYWINYDTSAKKISNEEFLKIREDLSTKTRFKDSLGRYLLTENSFILRDPESSFLLKVKDISGLGNFLNDYNLSLGGVTDKIWMEEKGVMYLYKMKNSEFGQFPLNEYLATKVLDILKFENLTYVKYSLDIEAYSICSKSANFLKDFEEFVSMSDLMSSEEKSVSDGVLNSERLYSNVIMVLEKNGVENASKFIDEMIVFDVITLNFDRHLGNFGVIKNVLTGKVDRMAPLFDMGGCFFHKYGEEQKKTKGIDKSFLFSDRKRRLFEENRKIFDLPLKVVEEIENSVKSCSFEINHNNYVTAINKMKGTNSRGSKQEQKKDHSQSPHKSEIGSDF